MFMVECYRAQRRQSNRGADGMLLQSAEASCCATVIVLSPPRSRPFPACRYNSGMPPARRTSRSLTELFAAWREGDGRALDVALHTALAELQSMAAQRMHRNADLTLTPAGVAERSDDPRDAKRQTLQQSRALYATMSLRMRTVLVDLMPVPATRNKRGGAQYVTLTHSGIAETR